MKTSSMECYISMTGVSNIISLSFIYLSLLIVSAPAVFH